MLALGIRYLNGFVAASEPDSRERAEWPPHPARVFMALVAAHFATGADPEEREALLWLESLPPPALRVSDAIPRAVVTHYVPVNDKPGEEEKPPTAIIQSAPQLARDRQPRTFARVWPEEDTVYLVWPEAAPEPKLAAALESLCAKVTRIGHSTSLVQMWVAGPGEVNELTWVPDDERAELQLRVTAAGTLEELEHRYNAQAVEAYTSLKLAAEDDSDKQRQKAARKKLKEQFGGVPPEQLRPQISIYQGYARKHPEASVPRASGTVFDPHFLVFRLERQQAPFAALGLQTALEVVQRWREALVSLCSQASEGVREIVSGHDRQGGPLQGPHLALIPLAFVGHPHADGHILGLAAVLPKGLGGQERLQVLRLLGRVDQLRLGPLGVWNLVREISDRPLRNLRPETWTAYPDGATYWSSVTPLAFDRHPKGRDQKTWEEGFTAMVADACQAVGLPAPRQVIPTPASAHLGVPPAFAFPKLRRKDGTPRRHTHAILVFERPVVGPVLLGAGRYRGYGVFRPMALEGSD